MIWYLTVQVIILSHVFCQQVICRIKPITKVPIKVKFVNEDNHTIQFKFCQGDYCSEKVLVDSGKNYVFETNSYNPNPIFWKTWIIGIGKDSWNIKVWETAGYQSCCYVIRKNKIYRSDIDDSNGCGTIKLFAIFDQMELSDDKKNEAVSSLQSSNYNHAAEVLLQAGSDKSAGNTRQLSAESGGRRRLKSIHGTFLRAYDTDWKVDMAADPEKNWENWYVEDHGGKVVFKAIHSPGQFLRAYPDGRVDLVDRLQAWVNWTPFKNEDGSWSFLSVHGRWLSARQNGSVSTVDRCDAWEHFWLEWW